MQTFRDIRESNCYYVDKTAYVGRLLDEGKQSSISASITNRHGLT